MPSVDLGWGVLIHPVTTVLHRWDGIQVEAILVPAGSMKRYHLRGRSLSQDGETPVGSLNVEARSEDLRMV